MTMNKEFEYKGTRFNIKVELDQIVERSIDGKRIHIITINDLGPGNYYEKYKTETHNMVTMINLAEENAKKYMDNQIELSKTKEQKILESLGFK
jgi:hypothetical protein